MSEILLNASFSPSSVWGTGNDSHNKHWLPNFDEEAHIVFTFIVIVYDPGPGHTDYTCQRNMLCLTPTDSTISCELQHGSSSMSSSMTTSISILNSYNGTCTVNVTLSKAPCSQDQHFTVDRIWACPPSRAVSTTETSDYIPTQIPTTNSPSVTMTSKSNPLASQTRDGNEGPPTHQMTGAIIGAVIGGLILLLLICAMPFFFRIRKRRNKGKWSESRTRRCSARVVLTTV
ncbi:hypothetical protein C8Q74DRAFT_292529 [Fomes fomentarius]|nr:hypothetical protein C8Q74DRAFT_292529 [Fomes fomentarius]